MKEPHLPVLLNECLTLFSDKKLFSFLDCTVGAGGHAKAILEKHPEIENYFALDRDLTALSLAKERLAPWKEKISFFHTPFAAFDQILHNQNVQAKFDGILLDLGVSSMQLDQSERGFSFAQNGPLDMRMDQTQSLTAEEIINSYSENELGKIFRDYGEEKRWRRAAAAIVQARATSPITTTQQLVSILRPVLTRIPGKKIDPLTLVFQGLRIAVNQEIEQIETFLSKAIPFLSPGGRLAIISFHSLEDRVVKQKMAFEASDKWDTNGIGGIFLDKKPSVRLITRKPIIASENEIKENPRCRSAKMRCVESLTS